MGWNFVLIDLANHNEAVDRLIKRGVALRYDEACLIARDIPYIDSQGARQTAALVSKLVFVNKTVVKADDHQMYFSGDVPYGLDGKPIPNLGGGPTSILLSKTDVVVQRSFSNKPPQGFANLFDKFEHYINVIGGPAIQKFGADPYTFAVDKDVVADSVFHFQDTLTSRAEVGDLVAPMKPDVVAVIGLGGTGFYIFDLMAKTAVQEVCGFDGDKYHVHNAYRSPGRLDENDLDQFKADVCRSRYSNFRKNLTLVNTYIDRNSEEQLKGVTFAFVCVDKGSARAEIFDLLIRLGIPFIDVGMGLNRKQHSLAGTVRVTYYPPDKAAAMRDRKLAELVDHPEDEYRAQVQLSELNALNASIAVMRYKQVRGFYLDDKSPDHLLFDTPSLQVFLEEEQS